VQTSTEEFMPLVRRAGGDQLGVAGVGQHLFGACLRIPFCPHAQAKVARINKT